MKFGIGLILLVAIVAAALALLGLLDSGPIVVAIAAFGLIMILAIAVTAVYGASRNKTKH